MDINGIPVFEAKMDGQVTGIYAISLVDFPAVESDFLAFDKDKVLIKYAVQDEEKKMVYGVLMRANYPIYRNSWEMGEYYIMYKPETVRAMAEKLMADNRQNMINLMHEQIFPGGVNCVQLFIKDTANGISPAGFEDIEDGSLFGEFHVENPEVWALIKDGTFKGFSIEGMWNVEKMSKQKKEHNAMTKIKEALKKLLAQFGSIETNNGILDYEGENLEVGMEVTIEGNPAPDGEYETENQVIVVAEGKVEEIRDKEQPVEEAPAEEAPAEEVEAEEEIPAEEADEVEEIIDEVEEAAEDVEEAANEGRDLAAEIDALLARIAELEAKIAELTGVDEQPSIEETFEAQTKGMSKAERMAAYARK